MTTILPNTTTEPSTSTTEHPVTEKFNASTTKAAEVVPEIPSPTGQTASEICSQPATGLVTGAAVGGFAIGALLAIVTTLFIVALTLVTRKQKNKKNAVSLVAVNPMTHASTQEEETREMGMPEYCTIITNPASLKLQIEMKKNECYATIR